MSLTLPIAGTLETDVAVLGGGTTGCCAALASVRVGADTVLVEYNGFLGGNAAAGIPWLGFHGADKEPLVRGIPMEIIERLRARGGATRFAFDPICRSAVGVSAAHLKDELLLMAAQSGVSVRLHSLVCAVCPGEPHTLYLASKQGVHALRAKVIVDCTDSADGAALAGARYHFGREADGRVQVSSTILKIRDMDYPAMLDYFDAHSDQIRPFDMPEETRRALLRQMRGADVFVLGAFPELVRKAKADGLALDRDRLIGVACPAWDELTLVMSRVEQVDPNDVAGYTASETKGARQHDAILDFVRRYVPGGKKARLFGSGHQIGIRETRHVIGDTLLTADDLMSGREFEDCVALGGYHLDIHSPDHAGVESRQPPSYQIPFSCLLPKGLSNVAVAGRCISATHEAAASTRVIPISCAIGQAAGTAAAMAVSRGVELRALSVSDLRDRLRADGACIPPS